MRALRTHLSRGISRVQLPLLRPNDSGAYSDDYMNQKLPLRLIYRYSNRTVYDNTRRAELRDNGGRSYCFVCKKEAFSRYKKLAKLF